jgi:GAF domain-containing protein
LFAGRTIGVINLYIREEHHQDQKEEGFLSAITNTLAGIIERKRAESQLTEQVEELQRWHNATLGRETRVLDLKREVNELLGKAGQPPRYPSAET